MDIHFIGCGSGFNPLMDNTSAFFKIDKRLYVLDCGLNTFNRLYAIGELDAAEEIILIITHLMGITVEVLQF